jgi:DNA-binding CsgD family transcriptional regulator
MKVMIPFAQLTHLEKAVLEQLRTGATNKEIARTLALSPFTVREYVQRIARKFGCRGRVSIVALYVGHLASIPTQDGYR